MIDSDRIGDVLLAWCHNGTVGAGFMDCVISAIMDNAPRTQPRLGGYYPFKSPYIHANRSLIARYFLLKTDKQWLWMCDTDMEWPADTLYRMLDAAQEHECKILGAAYWNQYSAPEPYLSWLVFSRTEKDTGLHPLPDVPPQRTPLEVHAVSMGCTLIHRSVVQDVSDAYANDPWDTFGADIILCFKDGSCRIARTPEEFGEVDQEQLDSDPTRLGEDVTFCLRARKLGYPCYGLPTLVAEHIKAHPIRPRQGASRLWTPPDGQKIPA